MKHAACCNLPQPTREVTFLEGARVCAAHPFVVIPDPFSLAPMVRVIAGAVVVVNVTVLWLWRVEGTVPADWIWLMRCIWHFIHLVPICLCLTQTGSLRGALGASVTFSTLKSFQ